MNDGLRAKVEDLLTASSLNSRLIMAFLYFRCQKQNFHLPRKLRGEGHLRSTDTDTATGIGHGETLGHDKFEKIRIRTRQGHGIIK